MQAIFLSMDLMMPLNRHDVVAMMAVIGEDCVFENTYPPPDGERYEEQVAVQAVWPRFFAASPHAASGRDLRVRGSRGSALALSLDRAGWPARACLRRGYLPHMGWEDSGKAELCEGMRRPSPQGDPSLGFRGSKRRCGHFDALFLLFCLAGAIMVITWRVGGDPGPP